MKRVLDFFQTHEARLFLGLSLFAAIVWFGVASLALEREHPRIAALDFGICIMWLCLAAFWQSRAKRAASQIRSRA